MKFLIYTFIFLIFTFFIGIFIINLYVVESTKKQILKISDLKKIDDVDCILVLGASIWGDSPSPILEDRLLTGIELYNNDISKKILVSGDHMNDDYDEVNIMKKYSIEKGVPSRDILMDHSGFSTYESIYRAKKIFKVKKMIIVTQKYHLYRAIYIANKFNIEAYGIEADKRLYSNDAYREIREILARNKDFFQSIIKPNPTNLGEIIPITSDGDITNEK